jgi:GAF domain-containing protein
MGPMDATETARQRALDLYRVVDTLPEAAYDDIVRVAATVCGVPIALVSLIDRDRQWFKACVGLDVRETPRDEAVCDHVIRQPETLLEIADLSTDPRFAHFPAVIGDEGLRFYAGMPLVTPGGAAIGTVCVVDRTPRTLSDEQRGALEALSRLTINLLEARQRERVLERAALLRDQVHDAGGYLVAVFELQRYDALVAERGERQTGQLLQRLDQALESALSSGQGDSINRTTGQAEFIAMLHGDGDATLARLREAVDAVAREAGVQVLVGVARALDATEAHERVFLRADAALSQEKDRLAHH